MELIGSEALLNEGLWYTLPFDKSWENAISKLGPALTDDVTIEYLFGYINQHLDSHAAQIEKVICPPAR